MKQIQMKKMLSQIRSTSLPPALLQKYRIIQITGAVIIGFGFAIGSVFGAMLSMCPFPALIGLALISYSFVFRYTLAAKGWEEVSGVCTGYASSFSLHPKRHNHSAFLLQTSRGMFSIPCAGKKEPVPIGAKVTVYVPKNPLVRKDLHGCSTYPQAFGYEVTGIAGFAEEKD